MPRGYPDFKFNPGNYGQFEGDNAELAVRLGSPDVFERKGKVLWMDDMSNGLYRYVTSIPVGTSLNAIMIGGFLNSIAYRGVPALDGINVPAMIVNFPLITPSKLGIELLVRQEGIGANIPTTFRVYITYFSGAFYRQFRFWIYASTNEIKVSHGLAYPGVETTVITLPYNLHSHSDDLSYNYFKGVVDLVTMEYDRLVINQTRVSLVGYVPSLVVSVVKPQIELKFLWTANAQQQIADLCMPIVTIDEP